MNLLFQMSLTIFFISLIGWFVSFQYDPYRMCKDHPDPALRKDFYECEPGGFSLEKGTTLERSPEERFPWEKHGDKIIGPNTRQKRTQRQIIEDEEKNRQYKCKPEFYKLDPKDLGKINLDDYCEDKNKKTGQDVNIEQLDETSQEL